jgi:hypothetical protein
MALTILAVMTWADRDLAAPNSPPIYQPQLLLVYEGGPLERSHQRPDDDCGK